MASMTPPLMFSLSFDKIIGYLEQSELQDWYVFTNPQKERVIADLLILLKYFPANAAINIHS